MTGAAYQHALAGWAAHRPRVSPTLMVPLPPWASFARCWPAAGRKLVRRCKICRPCQEMGVTRPIASVAPYAPACLSLTQCMIQPCIARVRN